MTISPAEKRRRLLPLITRGMSARRVEQLLGPPDFIYAPNLGSIFFGPDVTGIYFSLALEITYNVPAGIANPPWPCLAKGPWAVIGAGEVGAEELRRLRTAIADSKKHQGTKR